MPSVRAAEGTRSAPRPWRRHGSPGGSSATKSGSSDAANASTADRLDARERAHASRRAGRPGRTMRAAAASSARWRPASSATSRGLDAPARVGPPAQHAQARARRVEQHPVERRRRRTGGGGRRRRAGAPTLSRPRPRRAHDRADARRVHVGGDHEARRRACARPRRPPCPPGAGATSRTRSPGCGSSAATTAWLRLVLRRDPAVAHQLERAEVAGVAHEQRVGDELSRARRRSRARGARSRHVVDGRAHRVHTQRDRRAVRCRARASRARRRGRARRRSCCTIQSGCEVRVPDRRDAVALRAAATAGPDRASERSTPLAKPRARSGTSADRLPHRGVRRHAGEELERAESQRRPTPRGRACRAAATTTRREQVVERAAHPHRAVDELGHERAVARRRARACRSSSGTRMCANAPSSMRTSASTATERARRGAGRHVPSGGSGSTRASPRSPARQAARAIGRLPSGCTSSSTSAPCAVASAASAVIVAGCHGRAASAGRAFQTFTRRPPTCIHAPGRGLPRAHEPVELGRAAPRVEPELLDESASRRRSARRPGASGSRRAIAGSVLDEQLACRPPPAGRAARPRSRARIDRHARGREDRPGVEAGLELHEAHAGLGVAREHRPFDRRRAAPARQQARSAGSRTRAAAPRATRPGAADRTRPRRRARAPDARTSSTTSRAFTGVSTGRPSSSAALPHG